MGKNKNKKIIVRQQLSQGTSGKKKRGIGKKVIQTIPIVFLGWSILILTNTFFELSTLFFVAMVGSILGTISLYFLWRESYFPIWMLFLCGVYFGAPTSTFMVFCSNYYFRGNSITTELEIVRIGHRLRRKGCRRPYADVAYNGREKRLYFLCQYERTISTYKKVRADLSEGLLGFYIIRNPELVK